MSTTDIHLLRFKIYGHLQIGNFECRYIRAHSEEKTSKISNITFAICLCLFVLKLFQLNYHSEYLESTSLDEKKNPMHFEMVQCNTNKAKSKACESQVHVLLAHNPFLCP